MLEQNDERACAMVIEHDEATRKLLTRILRRQSFAVESTADPGQALQRLLARDYAVVLLDLRLDDPGALRVLQQLRDRAPHRLRRVVILTAAVHFVEHGLPATVCRVLTKPFNLDELVAAVTGCAGEA